MLVRNYKQDNHDKKHDFKQLKECFNLIVMKKKNFQFQAIIYTKVNQKKKRVKALKIN